MRAFNYAQSMLNKGIPALAEYTTAAGPEYGRIMVWSLGDEYLIYIDSGLESYATLVSEVDLDNLAEYLEDDSLNGLEALIQIANIYGPEAVQEATAVNNGPFYLVETRYWYGPRMISCLVYDDYGRPLEFATFENAREWVKRVDNTEYRLAHGEYRRPTYKVVTE